MRLQEKLTLICLLIGVSLCFSTSHVLSHIEPMIKKVTETFDLGHESDAFSLVMLIKVRIDELHESVGFEEHQTEQSNQTCKQLLGGFVDHSKKTTWLEEFQKLENIMNQLASKCTNSDFNGTGLKGFDNSCALCVVLLRVMDNYIEYHKNDVVKFVLKDFCNLFAGIVKPTCEAFVHYAGPIIIEAYEKRLPADLVCIKLNLCTNPKCRLMKSEFEPEIVPMSNFPSVPSWQWLIDLFTKRFGDGHFPPFDMDNDTFSDVSTFRGYHWKGADCDELNPRIYPGRKQGMNKIIDHDCNGIFGKSDLGMSYETLLCDNTKRIGVAVIGDSAGAHFSIPEKYFNASMIKKDTYHDILRRVADELDLPQESGYTGHTITTDIVTHSVYKYLRNWNLCNNNDYQNIGVNGGDSGNTWGNIHALKRDKVLDHPLLMFFELIGNDVCSKSFDGMTTVEEFRRHVMKLLTYLDQTVPAGSHLWIFGLADGELLYDNLHDSIHPLNVTYSKVYDFLNCLEISPCWGWLNTNETIRKFATERAKNLSKVYLDIVKNQPFENFDVVYYEFPAIQILQRRFEEGGDPKDLIERCDGFHPNGIFHSYLADWTWNKLQTDHPDWIGPENPHNGEIRNRFNLQPFL